jgi:hypothetical protein
MIAREDAVIINSLVRQALVAAQEVMGDNGLNAVLRTSRTTSNRPFRLRNMPG